MTAQEIHELRQDAEHATWDIGYMRAVIDNPRVSAKLNGSFAGYTMEVANAAVKRSLALYCARAWDHRKDTISLPTLTDRLLPPTGADRARYDSYMVEYQKALADDAKVGLRVFRTEWLAHRVAHSEDRKKAETVKPIEKVTMNDLVARAVLTVSLAAELDYLWTGWETDYQDRMARAERYCREFWRVLPVLGEVER